MEETNEDKLISVTIGSRINIKSLAALTQYFNGQDIRSQGSVIRAALETLATILITHGKVDAFQTNSEALCYVNSIFPTKGLAYQKASTVINPENFLNKRSLDKQAILASLEGLQIPKKGEEPNE